MNRNKQPSAHIQEGSAFCDITSVVPAPCCTILESISNLLSLHVILNETSSEESLFDKMISPNRKGDLHFAFLGSNVSTFT